LIGVDFLDSFEIIDFCIDKCFLCDGPFILLYLFKRREFK
jgi:hypothetical protein